MAKSYLSETRTEDSILDLLNIQGWAHTKPPKGSLVRQNEYKAYPELEILFRGKSKSGSGDGYPDFLLIDNQTMRPLVVIEAKANKDQLHQAVSDAIWYGEACIDAGHPVIVVGIAGQENTQLSLQALKYGKDHWKPITYNQSEISWIPTKLDVENLLTIPQLFDLFPQIPRPEILAKKADLVNRILREAAIKDEYRPAYVGAMMLALWQTRGRIRKDPDFVLSDINSACQMAFERGGKSDVARSLRINEANHKLARSAWRIIATLEKLNVVTAAFDHDYLGQLYETFFRYTGGNTIGQYFTPRHIARSMADLCETTPDDIVKSSEKTWRKKILNEHTLLAVCELPDELFQPYASATTSVVLLEKGVPHNLKRKTTFTRIQYDGLMLKKGTRVARLDDKNQLPNAVDAILNKQVTPGFSGTSTISGDMEWASGAYIPSSLPSEDKLKENIDELLRRYVSFYTRYALEIANQRKLVDSGKLITQEYRAMVSTKKLENAMRLGSTSETIGAFFDVLYGQKELHSRTGIPLGDSLIISPTEQYNGAYGWLSFESLLKPPFVTVAQTGSIGEAFVQSEPCGVNDDCLVLLPKSDLPLASLFIAAAIIRIEKWRFSYGRKLTPSRINEFRMARMPNLEDWVTKRVSQWEPIITSTIDIYRA